MSSQDGHDEQDESEVYHMDDEAPAVGGGVVVDSTRSIGGYMSDFTPRN